MSLDNSKRTSSCHFIHGSTAEKTFQIWPKLTESNEILPPAALRTGKKGNWINVVELFSSILLTSWVISEETLAAAAAPCVLKFRSMVLLSWPASFSSQPSKASKNEERSVGHWIRLNRERCSRQWTWNGLSFQAEFIKRKGGKKDLVRDQACQIAMSNWFQFYLFGPIYS